MSIPGTAPAGEASLDATREQRLRRTLQAVSLAHPFYRRRFQDLGIAADDIRTLDDLQSLPLTTKSDYTADPESFRLCGDDLPPDFKTEERVLWDVAYTTGTTSGKPSPFYNTTHDLYAVMDQARRCNAAEGLVATDRVANLYPLANFPTGAFLSVVRSTTIAGLPVVHGLTGSANSEFKVRNSLAEALEKVQRLRPTVLWGVPSFMRRFLDEAQRRDCDFSEVRLVLTSGEPVSAALRKQMVEQLARMGAAHVNVLARYAFTEMQGGLVQCAEHAAVQNVCPDLYYLEVVDPDTKRRLPDGKPGMLAITHLHRRGTVLLRYLVGDVVTLSREPCPVCGRQGERVVSTPRRVGNLVKCRGMLVNTDLMLDELSALEGIGEFQVVFRRKDEPGAMDELVIRIEREENAFRAPGPWLSEDALREEVTRRVRGAVSIRPEIVFEPRGVLYDHERSIKATRLIDLRTPTDKFREGWNCRMDPSAAGMSFPPYEFHVERGKIREFADALGDANPIYRDPDYAARSAVGGILAPPTLLRTFLYEPPDAAQALKVADWSYIVHGEEEFEYFAPIVAGDVLTAQDRIVSITEKESRRAGKLQIAVIETTFHNQRGEKVQIARRTLVETGKRISE